jgi:hypothetical protein
MEVTQDTGMESKVSIEKVNIVVNAPNIPVPNNSVLTLYSIFRYGAGILVFIMIIVSMQSNLWFVESQINIDGDKSEGEYMETTKSLGFGLSDMELTKENKGIAWGIEISNEESEFESYDTGMCKSMNEIDCPGVANTGTMNLILLTISLVSILFMFILGFAKGIGKTTNPWFEQNWTKIENYGWMISAISLFVGSILYGIIVNSLIDEKAMQAINLEEYGLGSMWTTMMILSIIYGLIIFIPKFELLFKRLGKNPSQ